MVPCGHVSFASLAVSLLLATVSSTASAPSSFILSISATVTDGVTDNFCKEQGALFETCSERMEKSYILYGAYVDKLCGELAIFLKCDHETNITCPDMAIFSDPVYLKSVVNAKNILQQYCEDDEFTSQCSPDFIVRLINECAEIGDQVENEGSREELCHNNKEYLTCIDAMTTACQNDATFIQYNIPKAVSATEATMKTYCDEFQSDEPHMPSPENTPASHPVCSQKNVEQEVSKCVEYIQQPPEVTDVSGCRFQFDFMKCLTLLSENCPAAMQPHQSMIQNATTTLETLCPGFQCPTEIQNDQEDIVSWCMRNFHDLNPGSLAYCRELNLVPDCLAGIRDLCPPHLQPSRVDAVLSLLRDIFQNNCTPWGPTESTEEMSNCPEC